MDNRGFDNDEYTKNRLKEDIYKPTTTGKVRERMNHPYTQFNVKTTNNVPKERKIVWESIEKYYYNPEIAYLGWFFILMGFIVCPIFGGDFVSGLIVGVPVGIFGIWWKNGGIELVIGRLVIRKVAWDILTGDESNDYHGYGIGAYNIAKDRERIAKERGYKGRQKYYFIGNGVMVLDGHKFTKGRDRRGGLV